jgi:hypothetical protein
VHSKIFSCRWPRVSGADQAQFLARRDAAHTPHNNHRHITSTCSKERCVGGQGWWSEHDSSRCRRGNEQPPCWDGFTTGNKGTVGALPRSLVRNCAPSLCPVPSIPSGGFPSSSHIRLQCELLQASRYLLMGYKYIGRLASVSRGFFGRCYSLSRAVRSHRARGSSSL